MCLYFAENLAYLRNQKGFSQINFAQKTDMSQQDIASYEAGKREPALNVLVEIAQILEVSIDDLLTKDMRPVGTLLGRNLRYLRKRERYTQTDMAHRLGYKGKQGYSAIESGCSNIPVEKLVNISEFFGVTVDDLLKKDLSKEGNCGAG